MLKMSLQKSESLAKARQLVQASRPQGCARKVPVLQRALPLPGRSRDNQGSGGQDLVDVPGCYFRLPVLMLFYGAAIKSTH